MTGIVILIGSLGCLKEVKTMDMILGKWQFQKVFFLTFSNVCCRYTLELPLSYDVCVYILYNNPAISLGDRTGQSLQRPCWDCMETAQSSCNLLDLCTKISQCPYDVLEGSLRLSKEPTIIFLPCDVSMGYGLSIFF